MAPGSDGASLTFGVLGPLVVLRDDRPIGIGGPKESVVLAQLLVRANSAVSVDQLVEGLWVGRPPRSAARTLQAYVARLRGALEPNRARGEPSSLLRSEGSGYRLQVAPNQLDALLFEDLARRGAAQLQDGDAAASVTLRDALALWRGDAYGEFERVDACEAETRRLAELRLSTREDWFEAELARGCDAELVGDLEAAVADDPFRERQWRQLMIALYRAGRQRDALAAYQRCRSLLVEQLGIEPGPDVRALEAAILDQDPTLDRVRFEVRPAEVVFPAALEAAGPAFVGREGELSRLRSAWVDAVDGRGTLVSVLGEEGMGKTRLVAELAREVQRTGGTVLYARCGHPYQGVRTLLDEVVRSGGASLGAVAWAPLEELGGSVARLLAGRSLDRATLVAIDDLHEADAGTLEVLADLAEWSGAASLLVVTVFRTAPSADDHGVALAGTDAQVVLGGLCRESILRVCEIYAVDAWSADDITLLAERTGGVPLRVHELASEWARARKTVDVEEATSRAVTARARLAVSRGEIAASVEGLQHLLEQRRAHMAGRDALESGDLGIWTRCPYKGLVAFEPEDASIFFGRERLVAELMARLAGTRLLAVVGPSGSGKSSLVRAGLVPALTAGLLPVVGGWRPTILPAGPRPAQALRHAEAAAAGGARRLLFIDQFEEVLAMCAGGDERTELVAGIVAMAGCPDAVVVLAIRADHLGRCASYPALAELITGNDVLVGPMDDSELRRAIERPAHLAGCALEPGLVDVIVSEVAGRPGALPLLSTALAETWQRRTNRVLTHGGYRSAGGVNGALARLAEDTYQSLAPPHQLAMRRLLVRLSDAGDDADLHLRRRLPLSELTIDTDDQATRGGLDVLVERRLLTVDHDAVELTHEALLREWPRLRSWLDEDVQGRRLHRRLGEAAREWKDSGDGRAELYRGTRLDAAVDWTATHDIDVSDTERAFLEASGREARREVDQAHRIAVDKVRSNRRLRWLLSATAVLLVIAVLAGWLTLGQRRRADDIARDATARELAAESELALDEDPELAVLLGMEAVRTTRSAGQAAVPEAVAALQRATQANRLVYRTDGATFVDASPDGRLVAAQSHVDPNNVVVRDVATGDTVATLDGSQGAWSTRFSPDGRLLAVSHEAPTDGPAVVLWDTATWTAAGRLPGPPRQYRALAFSAAGDLLAATSESDSTPSRVTVWDVGTTEERLSFEPAGGAADVEFLGDTATLVVTEPNEARVGFYSTQDGALVDQLDTPGIVPWDLALEPSGDRLAISSEQSRLVEVWDLRGRLRELSIPVVDTGPLTWAPQGDQIAMTGANEGTVRIIDVTTGKDVFVLRGSDSYAADVAFVGPDLLASVSERDLRLWDVTADGPPELGGVAASSGRVWNVQTSPDGDELLVQTIEQVVERLDAHNGEVLAARADLLVGELGFRPDASPDWRYFGAIDATDGSAAVYDLATLAPIADLPACTSPTAFSPDGTMVVLDGRSMVCTPWFASPPKFHPPSNADLRSRIIDFRSGTELLDLGRRRILDASFHPNGRYLAVNVENLAVEIYDIATRRLLTSFDVPDAVYTFEWDRAGRWLAGGTGGGRIWALDVSAIAAGTPAADAFVLDRHAQDGGIPDLALSRDGTLVTVGLAGELRFWKITSGALLLELQTEPTDAPPTVEFSPDDRHLIYTDAGVIRRYPLDTDELITLADNMVTRSLTIEECRRYLATSDCP